MIEAKEISMPTTGISIIPFREQLTATAELSEQLRAYINDNHMPYGLHNSYTSPTQEEIEAFKLANARYLEEDIISPFLETNSKRYSDIHKVWTQSSAMANNIDIADILVLAHDVVNTCTGLHSDNHNRTSQTIDHDLRFPIPAESTNCKAYNTLYIEVFNHLASRLNPNISMTHKLVHTSALFAPEVSKEYRTTITRPVQSIGDVWTQRHRQIVMISQSDSGDLQTSVIDPYHTEVDTSRTTSESVDALDFSDTRGIDGLVQAHLINLNSHLSSLNITVTDRSTLFFDTLPTLFDFDELSVTDDTAKLCISAALSTRLLSIYTEEMSRTGIIMKSLKQKLDGLHRSVAYAHSMLETTTEKFNSELEKNPDMSETVLEIWTSMIQRTAGQSLESTQSNLIFFSEEVDMLSKYTNKLATTRDRVIQLSNHVLEEVESRVESNQEVSAHLLTYAIDFEMFSAAIGLEVNGHFLRTRNILSGMISNADDHKNAAFYAFILLDNNIYTFPDHLESNELEEWKAMFTEYVRFSQTSSRIGARRPNIRFSNNNESQELLIFKDELNDLFQ